jgi:sterol desaturase/sphingolipid hydroxylase (fatty acid hydroxylase superfamily)
MWEFTLQHLISSITDAFLQLSMELVIFGAIFLAIERIRPAEKKTDFIKSDSRQELALAMFNISIIAPLFYTFIVGGVLIFIKNLLPYQIFDAQLSALPALAQIIAACFILDFATYWRHRFTHRVKWLWPFHSIHHAAQNINWLTSMRLHPIDFCVALTFNVLMLHVFGFSAGGITLGFLVYYFYNFFTHANLDLQFPKPFRYILASPNFHRWHDLMFGTYYHPEELPKGYGLEPAEQTRYPNGFLGWLAYPFRRADQGAQDDVNAAE